MKLTTTLERTRRSGWIPIALFAALSVSALPQSATADEGGVSFWVPGFFGSLAATPQQPGWSNAFIITTRPYPPVAMSLLRAR
jgi:hypothetical protein